MQNDSLSIKKPKKWHKNRTAKIISFAILFCVCCIFLLPLIYMLGMSFRTSEDILLRPNKIFPTIQDFTFDNYKNVLFGTHIQNTGGGSVLNSLKNSLIVSGISVVWAIIVEGLAAYAFTFLRFKGRVRVFAFVVFTMAIPGVIGTTIRFAAFAKLGQALDVMSQAWYYFAWLIIPGVADVYHVLLIKNYFDSVPYEIIESARSDGASDLKIFLSIILPLARSTLLLVGMFTFTSSWNNLFWANLIVGPIKKWNTITVYLSTVDNTQKGRVMAASVVSLMPILVAFMFMQNKMIDGPASTGVKK